MAASPASPLAVLGSGPLTAYWRFHDAVSKAQLASWLPAQGRLLIDISGSTARAAMMAAARGHTVIRVLPMLAGGSGARGGEGHAVPGPGRWPAKAGRLLAGTGDGQASSRERAGRAAAQGGPRSGRGRVLPVLAEPGSLGFLSDACADGVIAEEGALSRHLMTEDLAAEIVRVLRPGGELLACVDSLVLGMALLAQQRHWAHLVDLPHAEVVLIPWPDGTITRCFGAAQLADLLTEAGLEVNWIRPRTVLSPSMVDHVLRKQPGATARLVRAELQAADEHPAGPGPEESFGIRLLASARKPMSS